MIVRQPRIGGVPSFRFYRLQLPENFGAIWILGRDPVGRFEIVSLIGVLLGLRSVDRFLLPGRDQLRLLASLSELNCLIICRGGL